MALKEIEVTIPSDIEKFCNLLSPTSLTPETLANQKADAHWAIINHSGDFVARCSLWWESTPPYPGRNPGLIGHFCASSKLAASQLISLACDQLTEKGCSLAIAPMDGNTWRNYRFITERSVEPIFFLEPDNPHDWPRYFAEEGFKSISKYFSFLNPSLDQQPDHIPSIFEKLVQKGVQVRPIQSAILQEELHEIYELAIMSFQNNFLYTPLSEIDFISQYLSLKPYMNPDLILIAECWSRPVGFVFAIPDLLRTKRDQANDTLIVKTLAVHPDFSGMGLGTYLVDQCQQIAKKMGYQRAIHALIHQTNFSARISAHYGRTIRGYTLFAKELEQKQ